MPEGWHARLIVKEDKDLRGRQRGEVAKLLCRTVGETSPERECLTVLDEVLAFSQELSEMKHGDVIVIFYDQLEPVLEVLARYEAVPVASIGELAPQFRMATG